MHVQSGLNPPDNLDHLLSMFSWDDINAWTIKRSHTRAPGPSTFHSQLLADSIGMELDAWLPVCRHA